MGPNQQMGWYTTSNANVRIQFTVNTANQLVASENDGFNGTVSSTVATNWVAAPHKFRVEWNSTVGDLLPRRRAGVHPLLRQQLQQHAGLPADAATTDTALSVDWARVGPYATSGTFTSRLIDAGATVNWTALSWDSTVPSGTTLVVKVRTGNSSTPGGTGWTGWITVPSSGTSVGATSRYAQYQLTLTSSGTRYVTPAIRSVVVELQRRLNTRYRVRVRHASKLPGPKGLCNS